jgi:prepilin-type N-terminal cleavage/methylation domain-containing protein
MIESTQAERGFTLIEILVALAILGLILASFAGVVSGRSLAAGRMDGETQALLYARSMMERLGRDLPLSPGEAGGPIAGGGQWRLRVRPTDGLGPAPAPAAGFATYVVALTVSKPPVHAFTITSLRMVRTTGTAP